MRRLRLAVVTATAALLFTSLTGASDARPAGGFGDWPGWQGPTGTRFNPVELAINPLTVGHLKLKWAYAMPKTGLPAKTQPAVVGDHLYFGDNDGHFFAVNARTGAAEWTFDLGSVGPGGLAIALDGPTVARGKVFFGDSRGYVFALDRRTGTLVWARDTEEHPDGLHTSSPLYYQGRVYIGASSAENVLHGKDYACCTFRGHLDALDADTGKQVWRHYTVPEPKQNGTWPSGAKRMEPSGAGVWSTPVVDPLTGTVYVGVGQNYSGRGGEFDSLLALDARTGELRWHQQVTKADTWGALCNEPDAEGYCPGLHDGTALDYDIGASPTVYTARGRRLVAVGQKSGVLHVFDAHTGEVAWRRQLGVPTPGGGIGGIQWGTSFDGRRLYAATYFGDPGTLFAIDPASGAQLWATPNPADGCTTGGAAQFPDVCTLAQPPAVTTTPGLVWEGSNDGKMRAYSARDGKVLWSYDTVRDFAGVNGATGHGGAISGGGGAVVAHGMLYVMSGYSPQYPSDHGPVLLAFGL